MTMHGSPAQHWSDADLPGRLAGLRWLMLALLTGLAVAGMSAGVASESLLVRIPALLVAGWALLAAVPVHRVLGRLQRDLAHEHDPARAGAGADADADGEAATLLAPAVRLPVGYPRVS